MISEVPCRTAYRIVARERWVFRRGRREWTLVQIPAGPDPLCPVCGKLWSGEDARRKEGTGILGWEC